MKLTKKNIIGSLYWDVFEMEDGSKKRISSTEKKYKGLAKKNPTNPTIENGRWLYSYSDWKYDTKNGELEDGTYGTDHGCHIVKLKDRIETIIPLNELSNNIISEKGQDIIEDNYIRLNK